ncbi:MULTISPECIES: hypothetical protein [Acinetobacter]|uniref:hypothetical protein n=1 Tax=Acinetobacter TaxID=469 RepID=UPI000538FA4A|nr:hypothetical protein [Acinetobacter sp. HR7]KGT48340.1 hypothetical protein GW12_05960 [Acinetobacter sp. HR7]
MNTLEVGQRVQLAQFDQYEFKVTEIHQDNTYTVETQLGGEQVLTYQNVAREMLKLITE